ncbi:MAG TPA: hypothetical protein VFO19_21110, partial [Vicinamibacterales bacterium]|nr:hypothetical protein [Vicinamibacterales bacterium]
MRAGFSSSLFRLSLLSGVLTLATPSAAQAQWYVGAYLGANHTPPASVEIVVPSRTLSVEFEDVEFEAKPFSAPQYYGWRVGRMFGASGRIGVELEFVHAKMYAKTDRIYPINDRTGLLDVPAQTPMSGLVQRYAMSHGLNFILFNVVVREPLGEGPVTLVVRGGAGPTLPHAESTVLGVPREQYEYGGIGLDAGIGLDIKIRGRFSAMSEYKLTYAKPEISVAGGTGQTTALAHQINFGVTFGFAR